MIDGIKVLEEIHVVGNIGYILFGILMCGLFLWGAYTFWSVSKRNLATIDKWVTEEMRIITKKECVRMKVSAILFLVMGIVLLVSMTMKHFNTDFIKYRVFIEDTCSYNQFTNKYMVIKTFDDGSVMIREKE